MLSGGIEMDHFDVISGHRDFLKWFNKLESNWQISQSTKLIFICTKSIIETLEKGVKYNQS